LIKGKSIARILYAAGLASSVSDAHRLVIQQGAYVAASPGPDKQRLMPGRLDWTAVKAWFPEDTQKFLIDDKTLILRKGRRNVRIVEMVSDEEWKASGREYPGQPYTGEVRKLKQALREEFEKNGEKLSNREFKKRVLELGDDIEALEAKQLTVANNPNIVFPRKRGLDRKGRREDRSANG
jgi:tyrosyl-tRNA synthetase